MAGRLAAHLEDRSPDPLDVSHTLLHSRAQLEHRAVLVAADQQELLTGLDALAQGKPAPGLAQARAHTHAKVAFCFPGQGPQWLGMASELLDESALFPAQISRCEEAFAPYMDTRLTELLRRTDEAWLSQIELVQPALFATMVALAQLWRSHGIEPSAVIGHSQGEIAAAVVIGALSLEDGAKLVATRARLLVRLLGKGETASVQASATEVEPLLAPYGDRVAIAAENGPRATTLSGEPEAIEELIAAFGEQGTRARMVAIGVASHSAQMEQVEAELKEAIADIAPREAAIPFYSTLLGEQVETTALDVEYWYRNLREPVRFHQTARSLLQDGHSALIEVSSHPVLAMSLSEAAEAEGRQSTAILHTLRREEGGTRRLLSSLAEAHAHGIAVDFTPLFEGSGAAATELPTYPFQRQRYWLELATGAGDLSAAGQSATEHPLLAASIPLATEGSYLLTGRLSQKELPWLADHAVAGTAILPGTAFAELCLRAGQEVGAAHLQELILEAPLPIPAEGALQLQVIVTADEQTGAYAVEVHARPEPGGTEEDSEPVGWARHASATLAEEAPEPLGFDATNWPPVGGEPLASEDLYERLDEAGLEYGPAFQGLEAAWQLGDDLYAEVALAPEQEGEAGRYGVHPALLDAAIHPVFLLAEESAAIRLPFTFSGVAAPGAAGAKALRVRLSEAGGKLSLEVADPDGNPVAQVGSIAVRELDPAQLSAAPKARDALFGIEWTEVELAAGAGAGKGQAELLRLSVDPGLDPPAATRALTAEVLERLQAELAKGSANGEGPARLAFLTEGAVALGPAESPNPALAAAWGLVRSAQSEHPGRFVLIDADGADPSEEALAQALALAEEPQLALRDGVARAPRLARAAESEEIALPAGPWRLAQGAGGTLEDLQAIPAPEAERSLREGEVRVRLHAAGLNFRDALIALGMYPGEGQIGGEGAGVVSEVADGVTDLKPGDRVFGVIPQAFAPLGVAHRGLLAPLPEGWSFEQGAAISVVGSTAYFGLVDLADLKAGERVLIHAGAGGVGTIAIQLARHLGAEVFATASPGKWEALRDLGLDEDHIASSRDLEFKEKFLTVTGGEGMDVVLDSLAREFVDGSLDLLPRGGRFLEMGKTDVRDPEQVAKDHPGVAYHAFDLFEAGPGRNGEILAELLSLFEQGAIEHSPISPWDVREAKGAFRFLSQARHVGKLVLTIPQPIDPEGTVLVTGGLSGVGTLTARHLAEHHGARHLLLTSRRGPEAPGAAELIAELAELGCEASAVACDVSDRSQVDSLIASIPTAHPLAAVVHSAALLDDGTIESLDPERLATVLAPKADAAWHLHEATSGMDLAAFVLYSSAATTFGAPGQGNYAAANAFLEGLAQARRAAGLPATAIAWGLWGGESELVADSDRERFARLGVEALDPAQGLALLDRARGQAAPLALAAPLQGSTLRSLAAAGLLPPLFSGLLQGRRRRSRASADALARRLAKVPVEGRQALVLELIREQAAAVLGHSSPEAIDPTVPFKDLGFDSLGAVELRNRLAQATGVALEATLVFDYPTAEAAAGYLLDQVQGTGGGPEQDPTEAEIRRLIAEIPAARLREAGVLDMLRTLEASESAANGEQAGSEQSIDTMDIDQLVRQTLETEKAEG
jgi:acyl transferase domain-containing protein/D-arabinose 1-dehydrogenase-like Zn-dependent alcohol dehydrogenase/NADP-dependent 3-hydroxy acid dehydrogenase YdfG/acyl carrier protein